VATPQRRTWTLRAPLLIRIGAVVLLVTVLLGWGMGTRIAGAVIGNGKIEVATTLTVVQHPLGGLVAEVLVTNGDSVTVGDVLIRLDDRALRSDLAAAEGELFETLANIARLEAILDAQRSPAIRMKPFATRCVPQQEQMPSSKAVAEGRRSK
jgi:HlyD family secretion protein